jgi:zinc transport system ATP-binding protein
MMAPETPSRGVAIELSDLSFRYGDMPVLEHVTLSVQRGEFLGLIGPNGGGKTTLLRILLGLEADYTGEVRVFGEHPARGDSWRRKVGVVPQRRETPARFPVLVRDVVEMGLTVRGAASLSRAQRALRIHEALAQVGIDMLERRPLRELSGGQRQRVLIARALINQPEILILDEPTVGVDAHGQDLLLHWIDTWRKESGLTVILVSHDIGVIAPLADRLACLNVRLHFHDRPDRLTGAALEAAYGCPAELIFHSHDLPHRVVGKHGDA